MSFSQLLQRVMVAVAGMLNAIEINPLLLY
ncbi:hypothetical protein G1ANC_00043 [Candidatus Nanosynsacchari sp. TM7_ANC_38.39_G1_1]|nr:hypothetical protein G1ANC_00043 [Candidatus Nanosynsacchari sp. TM7_ANC_38.39_G1_1]